MSRTFKKSQVISQDGNVVYSVNPARTTGRYVCATTYKKRVNDVMMMKSNGQEIKGPKISHANVETAIQNKIHTTGNMVPVRATRKASRFIAKNTEF